MDEGMNIAYLRLSKEDGDTEAGSIEESCSIQSQRACIKKYLQEHGLQAEDFSEIADDGYSGTTMDRPGMRRLIGLVKAGRVRTVIVRDLSRFARSYLEAGHYLEYVFPAYNVRFISVNDGFDSLELGETTGGLALAIRNLMNQMYSHDLSRKIKSAVDMKKRSGEFVYGTAPYGYKKGEARNSIVIDEPAARVVRQIFAWAADGITVTDIARRLNAAAVATPSVYLAAVRGNYKTRPRWSYESVRNILTNRIYTGDTVPFKSRVVAVGSKHVRHIPAEQQQVILNTHEAIVSRELYSRALSVIKSVKKGRGVRSDEPFTSVLVCGCCGNRLSKGKKGNKSWLCSMRRYEAKEECRNVRIENDRLEQIVLRAITTQCRLLDAKLRAAGNESHAMKSEEQLLQDECHALGKQIARMGTEKMALYEKYACGDITGEAYSAEKAALLSKEEALKARCTAAERQQALLREKIRARAEQLASAKQVTACQGLTELTPELTKTLIKRITVHPGGRLRIEWNFADEVKKVLSLS